MCASSTFSNITDCKPKPNCSVTLIQTKKKKVYSSTSREEERIMLVTIKDPKTAAFGGSTDGDMF